MLLDTLLTGEKKGPAVPGWQPSVLSAQHSLYYGSELAETWKQTLMRVKPVRMSNIRLSCKTLLFRGSQIVFIGQILA